MKYYGDYHTHSRHSDGRQSIEQIIAAAERKGLQEVAVTDHGPMAAVIGVKNAAEYEHIKCEVKQVDISDSIPHVLMGAEANIRDRKGTLDIEPEVITKLDILIAGMHPYTMPTSLADGWELFARNSLRHLGKGQRAKAKNANTKAVVEAVNNNPEIDILSHPGLFFTIDVNEVARACIKNKVLFEINCGHEQPEISDIMKADKQGTQFIINSDAHFPDSVGNLDYGSRVLEKLEIEPERVANLQAGGGYEQWGKKMKTYIS
ncbi:MAG: PHP domain-containing protein [Syntrophomonadaceae bacterium]|nr:PHP domain-containing protein [Syntrophomonadaceae bacterium]MDD3023883.1 PHP domain-containing protein [Syntrophomonadaceae bacterium]